MGHLMRVIERGEKINYPRACVEGLGAAFVGVMFMLMCQAIGLSEHWTGVVVGMSGWMGANASVKVVEILVYRKLGIKKEERE